MRALADGHTILVGEDELEVRGYLEMSLKCLGYGVELAQDGEEVINFLRAPTSEISAVLLDLILPESDGLETLQAIRQLAPNLPVIMMSGVSSTFHVVTAMKYGATDFLCKPIAHEDLKAAVSRALEQRMLCDRGPTIQALGSKTSTLIGGTPLMQEIRSLIPQIGRSGAPVLIQGDTGSGKEVLARELHLSSARANQIFLKLNCAALPSELVESELFGYERGAFTGAIQRKAGMFEMANGGTILLDEIGDMDPRLQAKLLQVLQDHEFQRIGGKEVIKVDVRVISATHRNLEKAIADGSFREDLYYRLNVINLFLPPLRERRDDILALAEHMLRKYLPVDSPLAITTELKQALVAYHWPGNVRELENLMRRYIVLRNPGMIVRELHRLTLRKPVALTPVAGSQAEAHLAAPTVESTPILEQVTIVKQQAEAEAILAALTATRWNRKEAAALLKIDYKALLYKMKKLGLDDKVIAMAAPAEEVKAKTFASGQSGL
jgi:two-component system, NtrC family, response regulator AtoC